MVMPRSRSSGALSMLSNSVNCVVVGSASDSTLVIAAVKVVLPWSMWPMVPTFKWRLGALECFLSHFLSSENGLFVPDYSPRMRATISSCTLTGACR